ncbi:MAG: hypothetical protein VR64_08065 [Desulfatitalea sp. BRH_c12]|nr:MAG: hypothetical protein VR64_08065 [Desulfatitalea sp. BRH_c12]
MYLARWRKQGRTHYTIRQSFIDRGCMKSRDLFDLGTDPRRHIVYVGGNGYYFDDDLQEGLERAGVQVDQDALDRIFFEFLDPKIQRVIDGFDRGRRRAGRKAIEAAAEALCAPHIFDKRRYHYLRFGHSDQRRIDQVSERIFSPLYAKSRDEREQYFLTEERRLRPHERPFYVSTIFELKRFMPDNDSEKPLWEQMDAYFVSRLCHLNDDRGFWADLPVERALRDYLVKYAIMYFDFDPPRRSPMQAYVEDFIKRHRIYHPPRTVQIKLEEAGRLFGLSWKELEKLDKISLSRLYRRLALKHHPDKGGDPDLFRRVTQYYTMLSKKGRRGKR